jgi:DNA polymerase-3 subunit epsilon
MQKDPGPCDGMHEGYCEGACEMKESATAYNEKVQKACASLREQPSFAIVDKGLNGTDQSCILVMEGKFYGMGYIPADITISHADELKDYITIYKENSYIRNLVNGYAARFPARVISLTGKPG